MPSILLVEDQDSDAETAMEQLHQLYDHASITRCRTLAEALDAPPHDLTLLDLGLPDSGGLSTVYAMIEHVTNPLVIWTSKGDDASARLAIEAGASDYLVKGQDDLRHAVKLALLKNEGRESLRQHTEQLQQVIEGLVHKSRKLDDLDAAVAAFVSDTDGNILQSTAGAQEVLDSLSPQARDQLAEAISETTHQATEMVGGHELALRRRNHQVVGVFVPASGLEVDEEQINLAHHQFRTPLTPLMLDTAMLAKAAQDEPRAERVRSNIGRLQKYADLFVDFLALQSHTFPKHKDSFPLEAVFHGKNTDIKLPFGVRVLGDPARTDRLIQTIKGMGADTWSCDSSSGITLEAVIHSWDQGPPEELFKPFSATSLQSTDTLALAVGRGMLRLNGGDLTAKMVDGNLHLEVTLPVA